MEKFKMPGVGIGVMVLDSDGKVLLILRNSNPDLAKSDMHLEGTWTLPAGKVGYGKTIIDAAKRKVKEEVNLTIENVKVIYISEKSEKKKLKNIISKFYKKMNDRSFYTEWLNEKITNDYENENFVFVVNGKVDFVEKVNEFLDINESQGYVINCYDIFDTEISTSEIIKKHEFYINTTGIVIKEALNL